MLKMRNGATQNRSAHPYPCPYGPLPLSTLTSTLALINLYLHPLPITTATLIKPYLHVPIFAQRCNDAFFDRAPAGAANRNSHFVMATQTIQLPFDLTCVWRQLIAARFADEMIRVIRFAFVLDVTFVDDRVALVANVMASA